MSDRRIPIHPTRSTGLLLVRIALLTALLLGPAIALVGAKEAFGPSRFPVPHATYRLGQVHALVGDPTPRSAPTGTVG